MPTWWDPAVTPLTGVVRLAGQETGPSLSNDKGNAKRSWDICSCAEPKPNYCFCLKLIQNYYKTLSLEASQPQNELKLIAGAAASKSTAPLPISVLLQRVPCLFCQSISLFSFYFREQNEEEPANYLAQWEEWDSKSNWSKSAIILKKKQKTLKDLISPAYTCLAHYKYVIINIAKVFHNQTLTMPENGIHDKGLHQEVQNQKNNAGGSWWYQLSVTVHNQLSSQCSSVPSNTNTISSSRWWRYFLIIVTYTGRFLAMVSSQQIVLWRIELTKGVSYVLCTVLTLFTLTKKQNKT